ncbi:EF-P lysine aminoacylase EpmA [Inmirania thermothiophila]|uniref:Lysyl-tRNA synthetase class 2 n=1 Tax=Inmirania thermothiophila TaxID=1750597 RepID=A0A3N1YBY3_9GAMM|nr:EF-P lysine aminoacylase EpmA [Inmirania thermothiophila]ROR35182.1 lysyl-tRNA synthetase class 2 [Inmirania thermothiophila]
MSAPDWGPACSRAVLEARARLLAAVRAFFAARGVLEVETPLLSAGTVTDPALEPLRTRVGGRRRHLQTSPEFHMKRLLAAGSGDIYQITRAFRGGERGARHNVEFTILEWYRVGWDHHRLMDEVEALLAAVAPGRFAPAERLTVREAWRRHLGLDPHRAGRAALRAAAAAAGVVLRGDEPREVLLDALTALWVQPRLGRGGRPAFLHDYPACQAALARVRGAGADAVAERFELYLDGMEIANGFHELTDPAEQARRMIAERRARRRAGRPGGGDRRLLAALRAGLPACAGVALGLDRLLMVLAGARTIDEVLAFPEGRA